MIYSQLLQLFNQASLLLKSAFILALIVGLSAGTLSTVVSAADTDPSQEGAQVSQQSTININTADASTLAAGLTGIGPSRAQDIVRYRETYGPFASIEELAEVKGVGKSTIDKNRHVLTLE